MKISCFFFFLLQPLAVGGYSNKGSKPSSGGEGKGGTQASVVGFKVGGEQIGTEGQPGIGRQVRTRVHSSPLIPPDSEITVSQGADLTILVTIVLCNRETCSYS